MRKLAVASLAFAAGVLLAHYVIPSACWNIVSVSAVMLAVLSVICCRGELRVRVLLICLFLTLGILRYDVQMRMKVDSTEQYVGQVHKISAVVVDYPDVYDDYSRVTVRLLSDNLPKVKAMFYEYNNVSDKLKPGDLIKIHVNAKGYVDNLEQMYKVSDKVVLAAPSTIEDGRIQGVIDKMDLSNNRIRVQTYKDSKYVKLGIKVPTTIPVMIYDCKRNTVTAGKSADLSMDDYIIVQLNKNNVAGIYVYRNFPQS